MVSPKLILSEDTFFFLPWNTVYIPQTLIFLYTHIGDLKLGKSHYIFGSRICCEFIAFAIMSTILSCWAYKTIHHLDTAQFFLPPLTSLPVYFILWPHWTSPLPWTCLPFPSLFFTHSSLLGKSSTPTVHLPLPLVPLLIVRGLFILQDPVQISSLGTLFFFLL